MTSTAGQNELPDAGDLVWVDFDPVRGTEQAGTRPALVVSPRLFHEGSHRAIVCPITNNVTPWTTKVMLPGGLAVQGAILVDQVRSVDRSSRGFRKIGAAPLAVLNEVRGKLAALIGIDLAAFASGASR